MDLSEPPVNQEWYFIISIDSWRFQTFASKNSGINLDFRECDWGGGSPPTTFVRGCILDL